VRAGAAPGTFVVESDGWSDTLAIGAATIAGGDGELRGDGEWLWVRHADGTTTELISLGGSRIRERGTVVAEGAPGGWLHARRDGRGAAARWVTSGGSLAVRTGMERNSEPKRG
jgi:hypothetical protein